MILKIGSTGPQVRLLQEFLNIDIDGHFGPKTEYFVKEWQQDNGLKPDGIVGAKTWDAMGLATTDASEIFIDNDNYLDIQRYFLPQGEYKVGPTIKEYLFLHHTAGWNNPFAQVDQWANDTRGAVGTEFLIGGPSVRGDDYESDGVIVQAIPEGGYGWHLGRNGSQHMHTHSIGIEVCNFGWVENGKTYAGTKVADSQIITLDAPFRGHQQYHRYSEAQLHRLYDLIIYIANRDNIDVRSGLIQGIRNFGPGAFEFNEDAFYGRIKGMWTHTNTRKDKTDMSPQPELLDMLLSI